MRICCLIHRETHFKTQVRQERHCSFGRSVSGFGASHRSIMAVFTIHPSVSSGPDTPKTVLDVCAFLTVLSHTPKKPTEKLLSHNIYEGICCLCPVCVWIG